MNFLALVQRLAVEVGENQPSTVAGASGRTLQFVNWINAAWMDIQELHQDWDFLRTSLTPFATDGVKTLYNPSSDLSLTDFGIWDKNSFRVYDTSAGINTETYLNYIPYDVWRDTYLKGALRSTFSRPINVTVAPDKSLGFGPHSSASYTIVGDYFKLPTEMSADADIPALPTQYHLAIVGRAMIHYGMYYSAQEVVGRGQMWYGNMINKIEQDRLPDVMWGGPLA